MTSLTASARAARFAGRRAPARGDDDAALVAAVRRGDDAAFARLYERYRRRIVAYAYRHVHDRGRAEDVTQDVFLSALRRMRGTSQPIAVQPWLYEIARNACIDHHRRSRGASEVSYDGCEATIVAPQPGPPAAVDAKTRLDDLRHAFASLTALERELVVLRELEGLSLREIGERLHLGRREVEGGLARAHARLSDEYDDLSSGMRCVRVQSLITAAETRGLGRGERVRIGSHVSHCGACRVHARRAGLTLEPGTIPRRLAALLPVPVGLRRVVWSVRASFPGAAGPAGGLAPSGAIPDWPAWTAVGVVVASVGIAVGAGLGTGASHTGSGHAGHRPGGQVAHRRVVSVPVVARHATLSVRVRGVRTPQAAVAARTRRASASRRRLPLATTPGGLPRRTLGPAGRPPSPSSSTPSSAGPASSVVRSSAASAASPSTPAPRSLDRTATGGSATASAPVTPAAGGPASNAPTARGVGGSVVGAAGQAATSAGGAVTSVGSAVTQVGSAAGSAVRGGATVAAGAVQSVTASTPATAPVGQVAAPVVAAAGNVAGNTVAAATGAAGGAVTSAGGLVTGVGSAVAHVGQTGAGLLPSAQR